MHAGNALWNLHVLVTELSAKAQNDPVLGLATESCRVLSDLIKVPLPDHAAVAQLSKQNDALRGVSPAAASVKAPLRSTDGLANEALGHCNYILDNIDEVPDKGEEFAESVRNKTTSMKETITKSGTATDKQITALENMRAGLNRWLRRE